MNKADRKALRRALEADWDAFPDLRKPRVGHGPTAVYALEELFPDDAAVRAWIEAQIVAHRRQYEGRPEISIGPRFADAVEEHVDRIPQPTRKALKRLAQFVRADVLPAGHVDQLAKALTVDGEFRRWLMTAEPETQAEAEQETTNGKKRDAYRFLAQRLHPDKGGDPDLMAALNELRDGASARRWE